jgi:hypothetical protein
MRQLRELLTDLSGGRYPQRSVPPVHILPGAGSAWPRPAAHAYYPVSLAQSQSVINYLLPLLYSRFGHCSCAVVVAEVLHSTVDLC